MVQEFSQNGWQAHRDTSRFTRFTAAGQQWWAANADVAVVFTEFVERFVAEVEPIDGPVLDDWSWAYRPIRGETTGLSNHAAACAWDLNSTKHPRGKRKTFSVEQRVAMHTIKNSITDKNGFPVLRLGMDYTDIPDDMHVEINASRERVRQAADKIRERTAQEDSMELKDQITLSVAGAKAMTASGDTPRKAGAKITLDYILQWGGPGTFRLLTELRALRAQNAALQVQTATICKAIQAMATSSSLGTVELRRVFDDGLEELEQAVTALGEKLPVTSDDTDDPQA